MLFTATYRYPGKDRLDITVKGKDSIGKIFAPTWNIVTELKSGKITEEVYTKAYYNLLIDRWKTNNNAFINLVNNAKKDDITLVCFCASGTFCHRYLLAKFLQYNWQVPLGGERK